MFFFQGLLKTPTGTVSMKIDTASLTYDGVSEYSLVDLTEGNTRMLLKRTGDRKLVWQVDRDLVSYSATWDLSEMPETKSVTLFLMWSPEGVSITCNGRRGGLWKAESDGTFSKLQEE
jgi:hypothetical protein